MNRKTLKTLAWNGIWRQNTGLAQLLGLCPLLAISTNMVNAVMLATATLIVMALANAIISLLRNWIPHEIRIPVFILIIAALVTVIDLLFNAWFHGLYLILGIFIPLITTNCIVLARVEAFAGKHPPLESTLDGIFMGVGLLWLLALLGALREFIASGTFLAGIDLVIPGATALQVLPEEYAGFLLAALPPGAFILLGFLIAGKNWLDERRPRVLEVGHGGATEKASRTAAVPGFVRCVCAMLYECLLLLAVALFGCVLPHILLGVIAHVEAPTWVVRLHFVALLALYFVWFWMRGGQTLAMKTWKIRVVDKSGHPLRPMQALFRYLAAWFSLMCFGAGFFWRLVDSEGQFLHDRLAGSRLIRM
jgi:electron transport complex protein RnfE